MMVRAARITDHPCSRRRHPTAVAADVGEPRHRNLLPTIDPLFKRFHPSLKNISRKWIPTVPNRPSALSRFAFEIEDRIPQNH